MPILLDNDDSKHCSVCNTVMIFDEEFSEQWICPICRWREDEIC